MKSDKIIPILSRAGEDPFTVNYKMKYVVCNSHASFKKLSRDIQAEKLPCIIFIYIKKIFW